MRRLLPFAVFVFLALPGAASAAQLIDRNASNVHIATNAKGEALLTYTKGGVAKHILIWGAINALPPTAGGHQAKFSLDYAGGWGKYHTQYWKVFKGGCARYDGPAIPNMVAACKASDGSYWAAQEWPQPLPDLGFAPWTPELRAQWLEVSHWSGALPTLEVHMGWVYQGYQQIFGRYLYNGMPVFGFGTTSVGAPTDNFGRLIYLDTHNSVYGSGWHRENSFVPHNPTGAFCYGFYPFDPTKGGYKHPAGANARRGPGTGEQYRITASGTGVLPNVAATIPGLHPFDRGNPEDVTLQTAAANLLRSFGDQSCTAGLS